jgi:hypothetical protein
MKIQCQATIVKKTIQKPLLGNGSATDTKATILRQQEDTTILGSGVFYVFHAEVLLAGQVRI